MRMISALSVAALAAGGGAWLAETLPARANVPDAAARRPLAARTPGVPSPALPTQLSPLDPSDAAAAADDPAAARALNRSIPFFSGPVERARPFVLATDAEDRSRALDCLATAVYYEAGFEPLEGERAVAQVVLNRVRHPLFPKSVCGVVFQGFGQPGCQFSFACNGSLAHAPEPAAMQRARRVAAEALAGRVEPLVGTSTHYHADYVAPYWGRSLYKIRQIGAHIFYRWPGELGRRAEFVGRYAGPEPPVQLAAAGAAPGKPAEPPERRADDDVGGRITPGLGWTPALPDVHGPGSAYERLVSGGSASPLRDKPPA